MPSVDIYDSWELVTRHMPVEQPPATASYIIFKKGSKVYAKNGETGHIEYEDIDAATVIQDAVNGGNKWVHIKAGVYDITQAITLPDEGNLKLTGDGANLTVLRVPTGYDNNIFEFTGTKSDDAYFNVFADMQLRGNPTGTNNTGFKLDSTGGGIVDSLFINLFLWDFAADCVYINQYNTWANVFFRCTFEHGHRSLLFIAGNGSDLRVLCNKFLYSHGVYAIVAYVRYSSFIGNWLYKNDKRAIQIGGGAKNNTFGNNIFFNNSYSSAGTYDDIYVEDGDESVYIGNVFCGNTNSAINILTDSTGNLVQGNIFIGSYGTAPVINNGTNNTIRYNKGYTTENEGIATFSGDGTTTTFNIPHGLVGTPSKYGVSPLTPDADAARTITVDATNITITFDTAPPSGTDNIKFGWWARV